jgi:hypothetical protein
MLIYGMVGNYHLIRVFFVLTYPGSNKKINSGNAIVIQEQVPVAGIIIVTVVVVVVVVWSLVILLLLFICLFIKLRPLTRT